MVFDDNVRALEDMSFDVQEGETRIILGSAGSGKTVLLKTAMGLIRASTGRSRFRSRLKSRRPEDARKAKLFDRAQQNRHAVPGERAFRFHDRRAESMAYPLLNQKAIQMPRDKMEPAVRGSLRFVELEHTMERYPSELSGGMRRRVAIARAVVSKPPLLLYDSPTAGLDPITAHTIMALIIKERDVWDNTTALVVTHRYQDGNLVTNFRYNPDSGRLDPVDRAGAAGTGTQHGVTWCCTRGVWCLKPIRRIWKSPPIRIYRSS